MTKVAIIISGILLFAGVAAASSLTSLGAKSAPTLETPTIGTTTGADVRREDRHADRQNEAHGRANEPGEDLRGPCDEAEHANDPRCTGASAGQSQNQAEDDADHDRRGNSGPGSENSGPGSDNSGPGGDDRDD